MNVAGCGDVQNGTFYEMFPAFQYKGQLRCKIYHGIKKVKNVFGVMSYFAVV